MTDAGDSASFTSAPSAKAEGPQEPVGEPTTWMCGCGYKCLCSLQHLYHNLVSGLQRLVNHNIYDAVKSHCGIYIETY